MSLALLRRCNPGGFLLSFFHKHTGLLEVLTFFLFYLLNCHTAFNMTLPPHRRTTCWLSTSQLGSETLTRKQQMTTCRSQRVSKCQILWDGVMLVMLPACPGARTSLTPTSCWHPSPACRREIRSPPWHGSKLTSHDSHGPENRHRDPPARQWRRFCKGGPGSADRVLRRVHHACLVRGQRDLGEGGKEDHCMRPHHKGSGTARFLRVRVSCHRGRLGAQGTTEGMITWPRTPKADSTRPRHVC